MTLTIGDCSVDLEAARAGASSLTPQEVGVLRLLAAERGRPVPRLRFYREVWGYRSRPRGRALDFVVLRLRQKLGAGARNIETVRGVGYRLVEEGPPPRASEAVVPFTLDAFVGRRAELDLLSVHLESGGHVGVLGPAGVGKSRLVREWVSAQDDDVVWIACHEICEADDLGAHIARSIGLAASGDGHDVDAALVGNPRAIVVLDDADRCTRAVRQRIGQWRRAAPTLRVITTSRQVCHAAGEVRVPVGPLPPEPAVQLLCARAESLARPIYDQELARRVVGQLDGLPLAIELAAARLRVLTLGQLDQALEDRFTVLRQASGRPGARFHTLADALEHAYETVPPDDRVALVHLARAHSPLDTDAVALLWSELADHPLDIMERLVDQSMVQPTFEQDGARFELLASVREFVWLHAGEAVKRAAMAAHARVFAAAPETTHDLREDLRRGALAEHEPDAAAQCAARHASLESVAGLRRVDGLLHRWRVDERVSAPVRAQLEWSLGWNEVRDHRFDRADEAFERARIAAAEGGSPAFVARAWLGLARCARARGDLDAAFEAATQAREAHGDDPFTRAAIAELHGHLLLPDTERALSHFREALTEMRRTGVQARILMALVNVGSTELAGGNAEAACVYYDEGVALAERLPFRGPAVAALRVCRAHARVLLGQLEAADADLACVEADVHRFTDSHPRRHWTVVAARLALGRGRVARARELAATLVATPQGAPVLERLITELQADVALARETPLAESARPPRTAPQVRPSSADPDASSGRGDVEIGTIEQLEASTARLSSRSSK